MRTAESELMTLEEVCSEFPQIKLRTLRRRVDEGEFTSVRDRKRRGSPHHLLRAEVEAYARGMLPELRRVRRAKR